MQSQFQKEDILKCISNSKGTKLYMGKIKSIKIALDNLSLSINNLYKYNEYMINISKLLLNKNINSQ